jgi:hypothetical protein
VLDAFHRGLLSQTAQEKLLADIEAQVLRLESGDADGTAERKPSPGGADGNQPAE